MKKILIVDDESSLRKGIAVALRSKGYMTLEAEDGAVGLDLAINHKPDLVISDVYMDNMNGFVMVENLKEDPETAHIPVIMMTSAAQGAGAWKSEIAVEYLEKPFQMPKLVEVVERILSGK